MTELYPKYRQLLTKYIRSKTKYKYAIIRDVRQNKWAIDIEFRKMTFDSEPYSIYECTVSDFYQWLRLKKLNKIIGNIV